MCPLGKCPGGFCPVTGTVLATLENRIGMARSTVTGLENLSTRLVLCPQLIDIRAV